MTADGLDSVGPTNDEVPEHVRVEEELARAETERQEREKQQLEVVAGKVAGLYFLLGASGTRRELTVENLPNLGPITTVVLELKEDSSPDRTQKYRLMLMDLSTELPADRASDILKLRVGEPWLFEQRGIAISTTFDNETKVSEADRFNGGATTLSSRGQPVAHTNYDDAPKVTLDAMPEVLDAVIAQLRA